MSEVATEIATFTLAPGLTLTEGKGQEIWTKTIKTLKEQPGLESIYWGTKEGDDSALVLLIEWTLLSSHHDFMAREIYKPFIADLLTILTGEINFFHTHLGDRLPPVLDPAATVQVLTIYSTAEKANDAGQGAVGFVQETLAPKDEYAGGLYASTVEDDDQGRKRLIGIVGWKGGERVAKGDLEKALGENTEGVETYDIKLTKG